MEALLTGALTFAAGFTAFYVTGLDDTATYASVAHSLRRSKRGRNLFFSGVILGTLMSLGVALVFASILGKIPHSNYLAAGVLFALSWMVYSGAMERFVLVSNKEVVRKASKGVGTTHLISIGIISFFATGLDDTIAYSALLVGTPMEKLIIISGVVFATVIDLAMVSYLAKRVKMNYKMVATVALAGLGVMVWFGLI